MPPPTPPPSASLVFGWTGAADTQVAFSSFYSADHTIAARVLFQYPYAYEGPIFSVKGTGNYVIGQGEAFGANGAPLTKFYLDVEDQQLRPDVALLNNHWYHVAVVRQANSLTVYLDGNAVAPAVTLTGRNAPSGTLRLGRAAPKVLQTSRGVTHEGQFYGKISDLAVYNRAFSAQELKQLVRGYYSPDPTNPDVIATWNFLPTHGGGHPPVAADPPLTLVGDAKRAPRNSNWNGGLDLASIALPTHQTTVLPFARGEAWYCPQGWGHDTSFSHFGYAAFCWDFVLADRAATAPYPDGTMFAPVHAPCSGTVVTVGDTLTGGASPGPTGQIDTNQIDIRATDGLVRTCLHLQQDSVVVRQGQNVAAGQFMALVSQYPDNPHLHMASANTQDHDLTSNYEPGFVTVPIVFSNYEVRQPNGSWLPVALGIPQPGEVLRRP